MNYWRFSLHMMLLSLLVSNTYALPLPPVADPAGRERELLRREQTLQERRQIQERDEQLVAPDEVEAPDEGPSFVLNSVRFTKPELLTAKELKAIVLPYLGKETRLSDLNRIVAEINAAYQAKGIYTATALLPKQEVTDGVVIIRLVEGKLGEMLIEGNSYLPEPYVRGWVPFPKDKTLVDMKALESDILEFNRVNDARLQAELRAGKDFGLTDIVMVVDEPLQNNVQLFVDNYGYESSGENEVGAIYRRQGVFTGSDRGLLYALASEGNQAFTSIYSAPVKASGWRLGGSLSVNRSEVTSGDFQDLAVEGDSTSMTLDASWLAISTRTFWLNALGSAMYSTSKTSVLGEDISDYDINKLNTGAQFTWLGSGWQLSGRQLVGWVSTHNQAASGTDQSFAMLSGDASGYYRPGQSAWYGLMQMDYQYTNEEAIPGAVAYSIGGPTSIRGYAPGLISGDYGIQTSLEAHYSGLDVLGGALDPFVFYDIGTVLSKNPTQTPKAAGVGLGWSGVEGFSVNMTYANALADILPNQDDWVFYARLSWEWEQ
ncbi:ShlB/FhaC/HecB family hemolysin secretion/activation protein [Pseudomonas sp. SA3-5]|uniref:ShlB/FhaC/HecB family hemolysin secretion/activation protein n=1 Tax=Pseudomonas aestuarii TaxID=3018340 RepID=A0ABT4XEL9_9PSED|nr:ShlB/FhaC/HecB family hemolysin secretion/activation protein [Pseudomonas aestuarii]MDA7086625.1 ShlB/FhaC/HecB family hemolysin secretion/activation protein [Pseudomonas aestuarii]